MSGPSRKKPLVIDSSSDDDSDAIKMFQVNEKKRKEIKKN